MAAPLSLGLEVSAAARDNIQREDYDGTHYRAVGRMRLSLSGAAFLSVSVSFLNQSMTATFADVDFVSRVGDMTETAGGVDFGLSVNATISGDDFSGTIAATGVDMTGQLQGDFYGPLSQTPTEIGGAFALEGAGGAAVGGLLGVCTCITGAGP
jgi:hypothetical protein